MFDFHSLNFESVHLQNRLGRLVEVDVCCLANRDRRIVILKAPQGSASVMIGKSVEHFAFQLREKLGVEGSLIEFWQDTQGDDDTWLRWCFQWSGNSPLQSRAEPLPLSARRQLLWSHLNSGEPTIQRLRKVAAVA